MVGSNSITVRTEMYRRLSIFLFFIISTNLLSAQESVLDRKISLAPQRSTIYNILNQITESTGFFFIYDSNLVENEKQVDVDSDSIPLRQCLSQILEDERLDFKIIERHILIYKRDEQKVVNQPVKRDSVKLLSVRGQIFDESTKKPLPFVSVGIVEKGIGTVSNYDGIFNLKIPANSLASTVTISHLGYRNQQIPIRSFSQNKVDIFLETEYISIQEIIIRNIDPLEVIKKVYKNRYVNYPVNPIYITSFYREGVLKDSKYLNYSEALVKIFKSPFARGLESDQVKLIQSRKVINTDQKDTLIVKLKAGLKSSLTLDLIKNIPDFIDPDFIDSYNYSRTDIVSINSRNVYAIAFEQKETIFEPLYKGTLYIDMETYALVSTDFEINPKYVEDTDDMFIVKKSRRFSITPKKVSYSVSYILRNGRYYFNHMRGDLTINYKKRYHLFSNDFRVFLELTSCQLDTINVQRFHREDALKTNTVFLESKFSFDETYWGDYNIITPEEKISQALSRINAKMELAKSE